mmetsp:Transcript_122591/g.352209  ORF Transcript_122591/g.352209 Transcript_122591/m.352209 type:complete len:95 (-) Transcript_122591:225-509(-)
MKKCSTTIVTFQWIGAMLNGQLDQVGRRNIYMFQWPGIVGLTNFIPSGGQDSTGKHGIKGFNLLRGNHGRTTLVLVISPLIAEGTKSLGRTTRK